MIIVRILVNKYFILIYPIANMGYVKIAMITFCIKIKIYKIENFVIYLIVIIIIWINEKIQYHTYINSKYIFTFNLIKFKLLKTFYYKNNKKSI